MRTTRHPAVTGAERRAVAEDLAELYRAGSSIRGIAARTGRSYGCVHQLLLDAGVTLRPRGSARIRSN
ncbi:helix-turn-helix domain-containing protein [Streptomyces sp. NPDC051133]|uniref:helix-turn-helix domain-containing protein n=1 Tax=Streptomyces sp. NPDC051133 TaxID=3155521 RepID=UPI0034313E89